MVRSHSLLCGSGGVIPALKFTVNSALTYIVEQELREQMVFKGEGPTKIKKKGTLESSNVQTSQGHSRADMLCVGWDSGRSLCIGV